MDKELMYSLTKANGSQDSKGVDDGATMDVRNTQNGMDTAEHNQSACGAQVSFTWEGIEMEDEKGNYTSRLKA